MESSLGCSQRQVGSGGVSRVAGKGWEGAALCQRVETSGGGKEGIDNSYSVDEICGTDMRAREDEERRW